MAKIIGIDLGTSNSAAAFLEGGKPTIVPSAEGTSLGGKAFPSFVAFTKDGQLLVGEPARRQAVSNPTGTIYAAKRKMGTEHKFMAHGKGYTPQQISAFILQKIKRDSEAFLGGTVEKAVITVPAYFNDNQRQATKDAGTIAGLEVIRLVNEPTAACLAYGLDKASKTEKILVFDLGGGTLDCTLMDMDQGVFKVISTSGDTQLGGTDMDNALIDHIAEEFKKESGVDVRKDTMATQRVREAAEKAKIELSTTADTEINLPFITADQSGPKHLTMKLTRARLEQIVGPIVDRCGKSVDQALTDGKMSAKDVTRIILVGGPTRMPIVQQFVEKHVGRKVERGIDPMECVAMGAAVQAGVIAGDASVKDILLVDVTPLSLGLETLGGVLTRMIERNTKIPTKYTQVFSTASDNQPGVEIHVLQGERPMARDNVSLGKFDLVGIPPAPRGVPQIEVSFDLDANGLLHVSAKDLGTGKEQSIRITAPTKLSKDEVEKMVKQAESFAEEDKKRREEAEIRNEADTLAYSTEKTLKEHGEKIEAAEKERITSALKAVREALRGDDLELIKKTKEELTSATYKIAETLYKTMGAKEGEAPAEGAAGGDGAETPKENVVEAEKVDEEKGSG